MKPVYCVEVVTFDYANFTYTDVLHTTNHKFVFDLVNKLNNKYINDETLSFNVKQIDVVSTPSQQDVSDALTYFI